LEIQEASRQLDLSRKAWDETSARFGTDFARFQEHKSRDFRLILSVLATINDTTHSQLRDVWCDLVRLRAACISRRACQQQRVLRVGWVSREARNESK
jgi:hypothetical protein